MKNYYKILEIDKNASVDVIRVVYKSLVKKYHPDLREGNEKHLYEEKIKDINEAYDVLSDPIKRAEYDETFGIEDISNEQYRLVVNENINLKNELNHIKSQIYNNYKQNYYRQNNQNTYRQYTNKNAYYNNSKEDTKYNNNNLENNSSTEYSSILNILKEKLKTLIALTITIVIIIIALKLPFIQNFFIGIFSESYTFFIILIVIFYILFFRNKKWEYVEIY